MKAKKFFWMIVCAVSALSIGMTSCSTKEPDDKDKDKDKTPIDYQGEDFDALLNGSDYVILKAGASTVEALGNKVALDLRPDDVNIFLFDWAGNSFAGSGSGLDAFGYADDWQPLANGGSGWSGTGLYVNNDSDHGGTQLQQLANTIGGHESEYTLVVVTKINTDEDDPWLQIYGFADHHAELAPADLVAADGEWHAIKVACADLGTMTYDRFYDSKTEDNDGNPVTPGYKSNLYGYGITNGTAECCAIWYAKY